MKPLLSLALLSSLFTAGCAVPSTPPPPEPIDLPTRAAQEPPQRSGEPRLPVAGDRTLNVRGFFGNPIVRRSFFWNGLGSDDQAGLRIRHLWHLTDNTAIGAGVGASTWFEDGPDAYAVEGEVVGRYYFVRREGFGILGELTGGWMQATRPVPSGGTDWNMTFAFGLGLEVPVTQSTDFMFGVTYHHTSNALGRRSARNPSQNEAQFWLGMSYRL